MYLQFKALIELAARLDQHYALNNQSIDLVIHPSADSINFWLAWNEDRDGSGYEAEVLYYRKDHDDEEDSTTYLWECSLDQEELEATLHNASVDIEELIAELGA